MTFELVGAATEVAKGTAISVELDGVDIAVVHADDARRLVVRGFFAELVQQIGVADIQERLLARIDEELEASV